MRSRMIVMIAYDQNFGFPKFEAHPMPRSKDTDVLNFTSYFPNDNHR